MTFFTRGAPVRADVDAASGGTTSMPSTGTREEKSFARLFKMGARTRVLDGTEELKTIFERMKRRPIAVAAGRDRWSFATAAGRSEKPVADFRAECIW